MSSESGSSIFPRTDWADLAQAAESDEARLDRLIRAYWQPLRIFLVATFPSLKDQADLLLQDFAQDKILKSGWLKRADQTRGRFRDFLKTSLRHFVLDRLNKVEVRRPPVSLDDLPQELPEETGPSEEFDLTWVRTVLARVLQEMEEDCRNPAADQPRRSYIWEMFRLRLLNPVFYDSPAPPYEELIARFELRSPMDASNLLLSAKRIFKAHLHRVIRDYAGQDAATAAEIRELEAFIERLR